jgi:hypothetical protein
VSPALVLVTLLLQAEPAPAPAVTPPPPPPPPPVVAPEEPQGPPVWALGVTIGGAYRLAPAAKDVPPALGLAFSTFAGWQYLTLGKRLELGLRASFGYHRFHRTVEFAKMVSPGMEVQTVGDLQLSMGDFGAAQTLTAVFGRWRPWLSAGGGLSIGHFTSPEPKYAPGEARRTMPMVQAGVGFHVEVAPQTDGGLQLDWAHTFTSAYVASSGSRFQLFGDRLALRIEMQYRF